MDHKKYKVERLNAHIYQFYSIGVRGSFEMIIIYSPQGDDIYNLGFGVWNESLEEIDDSVEIRNGDTDKILATVAQTTLDFLSENPTASIYASGSSAARTRKYQMGINNFFSYLNTNYNIQGFLPSHGDDEAISTFPYRHGEWQSFQPGVNYDAFLLSLK